MNGTPLSKDAGRQLSLFVQSRRDEIVEAVVRSLAVPQPRSLGMRTFTVRFIDRLLQEFEYADRDIVELWVDSHSTGDAAHEYARLVVLTCATIASMYAAECGHSEGTGTYLALRANELERRFRHLRRAASGHVDPSKLVDRDEVINSFLAALEARDPATVEHSKAVGIWSGRLARELRMTEEQRQLAILAGTLHDIGKVATPTEILQKTGPLDEEEWEQLRIHPRVGAKMLEKIPSLAHLAPVVRAHHERYDGFGYPDKLSGNGIPILARIVSVADCFHAMISKRPYREALSTSRAVEELERGAGSQWDGIVVDAMLTLIRPAANQRTLRTVRGLGSA
ncbi:MAG: HD-GYP domain-containing protein [Vulcanimicrobiaceae bacterium]